MKITDIKQQVKRADRYSVYVDARYAFSLSEAALLERRLARGQDLSAQQLADYKKLSVDDKLYNNSLRYSVLLPRSRWEMESYLKRKQADEPTTKQIIEKIERLGLLDDRAFAQAWVANRRLLKSVSKRRLTQELKQKRVDEDIIRAVLDEEETDERSVLVELVAKKRRQSQYQDTIKLMQYLARQGFSYDDIKFALQSEEE